MNVKQVIQSIVAAPAEHTADPLFGDFPINRLYAPVSDLTSAAGEHRGCLEELAGKGVPRVGIDRNS